MRKSVSLLLAALSLTACQPDAGSSLVTTATGPAGDPSRVLRDNAVRTNNAGGGIARVVGVRGDGTTPIVERDEPTNSGIGGVGTPVITRIRGDGTPVVERLP